MQYNKTAKYSIIVKLDQQIGSWWSRNPKICSLACQSFLQKAMHTVQEKKCKNAYCHFHSQHFPYMYNVKLKYVHLKILTFIWLNTCIQSYINLSIVTCAQTVFGMITWGTVGLLLLFVAIVRL